MLSCPKCHALVYAAELQSLAEQAKAAEASGNLKEARELWAKSLALLPPESGQYTTIQSHIEALAGAEEAARSQQEEASFRKRWAKYLGPFAAAAVMAWKFKALLLLALTKAKFLIFGLGKLQTLLSMFVSLGVYWSWYGWGFAVGFLLCIYVHEMGHVWMLRRYGLSASAPMFIPGLGAFISLYKSPNSVHENARIGLAGPMWGLAAAFFCWLWGVSTGSGLMLAIAKVTAVLNLFNLTPVWQLDGGRGFRALAQTQRIVILALAGSLWFFTSAGMFFLIVLGTGYRLFKRDAAPEPDNGALWEFASLLIALGLLASISAPTPGRS